MGDEDEKNVCTIETPLFNATQDENWEHAGPGFVIKIEDLHVDKEQYLKENTEKVKLEQFVSTAISGNDIASSCFYTIGLVASIAGVWAPLSLLLVIFVLVLYKNIYSEAVTTLPLNGGTYNILLNTTNKLTAATAASLTILSYVTTALVSAYTAMTYLHEVYDKVPIIWATIGVLGFFAILSLIGISESSFVASILFIFHILTLTTVCVVGIQNIAIEGFGVLSENWKYTMNSSGSVASKIFYGFCTGLLGVSGFESSSNFIEEQAPNVFPKTLRNMTIVVGIFNPLFALLAVVIIPWHWYGLSQNNEQLAIGRIAFVGCGKWLEILVSVDAVLVLSGAVITSYVGANGLVKRMTLDRCLPQFLLHENKLRKTNTWIILGFFILTSSLIFIAKGNLVTLSGVYTISFLSVLALFSIGNLLMKYKRSRLPREYNAPTIVVLIGLSMVLSALVGNVVLNTLYLKYFMVYFIATITIVMIMLTRMRIVRWFYMSPLKKYFGNFIQKIFKNIRNQKMIFFIKEDDLCVLNKAILYVNENEITDSLQIVHVYENEALIPPKLEEHIKLFDEIYPKIRIDLVLVKGIFEPALVNSLSIALDVAKNFMYLTTPSNNLSHRIADFGGVRLITH